MAIAVLIQLIEKLKSEKGLIAIATPDLERRSPYQGH